MTTCPGCDGKKTKRAQLCAGCRKRANIVGANLLAGGPTLAGTIANASTGFVGGAGITTTMTTTFSQPKLTDGQRRAFYAKANALDKAREQRIGTAKRELLARAGVESTNDLTQSQASDLLDWLDEQLHDERSGE